MTRTKARRPQLYIVNLQVKIVVYNVCYIQCFNSVVPPRKNLFGTIAGCHYLARFKLATVGCNRLLSYCRQYAASKFLSPLVDTGLVSKRF